MQISDNTIRQSKKCYSMVRQLISGLAQYAQDSGLYLLAWIVGVTSLLCFSSLPSAPLLLSLLFVALVAALKYRHLSPVIVLLLAASWGSWNFSHDLRAEFPADYEGQNILLLGVVDDLPNADSTKIRFRFKIERIIANENVNASELDVLRGRLIQLNCYRCSFDIRPDQQWLFTVRLKRPHGYASWGAFDYEKFLFRHQIIATGYVRNKQTNQLVEQGARSVNTFRWQIKNQLTTTLNIPSPGRAMIAALMIGDKSLLNSKQRRTFQATGVSHLMAISGLHIGLVFLVVAWLCKWLLMPVARIFDWQPRQRLVLLPALLAAFSYSALAGFAISTQRAFIMLLVFVLCRFCARDISLFKVLLIAASIILLVDPYSVLDAGFWLSCGAVLIIAASSHYMGALSLLRLQPLLWLGMIPLTVLFFGQVSLISPVVNLIMVPIFCFILIPLVLICLLFLQLSLTGLHQYVLDSLAEAFNLINLLLESLQQVPFALYYPPEVSAWSLALVLLLISLIRLKQTSAVFILLVGCSIYLLNSAESTPGEVRLALLDVGQGLAVVIEVDDYVLVYDTGPSYASGFNTADAVLLPYLRRRGINKIDLLIISHADNDHMGGYSALRNAFKINHVLAGEVDKTPSANPCYADQFWHVGSVDFEIISPENTAENNSNNSSCVLSVTNGHYRVLITGDIERPIENYLVSHQKVPQADFILVPHHGSNTSSSNPFLLAVKPKLALLAAGYRNRYGHPHQKVVGRYRQNGIRLESTADNGSMLLKLNNNNWSIQYYRRSDKNFWNHQADIN